MSNSAEKPATAESMQKNFNSMIEMINEAINEDPIFFTTTLSNFSDGMFVKYKDGDLTALIPSFLQEKLIKAFEQAYKLSDTSDWG